MNDLFHIIDDAQVILRTKGTYYQRKLYSRGARIYAQHGGGFIRLGSSDATSNPNVSWEAISLPEGYSLGKDESRNPTIIRLTQLKEAA